MGFIDNQNIFGNMPYGSRGTVADSGCGSIACFNALTYLDIDIDYSEVHAHFNRNKKVLFKGRWGTNPFSVKRYLKKISDIKVKTYLGNIPKKNYNAYIILNIYKSNKKYGSHYVFGHFENSRFKTYNLNRTYEKIEHYLSKNDTVGKLFVIFGIYK